MNAGENGTVREDVRVWFGRGRLGWWLFGLVLLAVLALVVERYLGWLVFGLFVYYVARPITRRLERFVPSPSVAAATTLLLIVLPVVVMLGALLAVALGQLLTLVANAPVDRILAQLPFAVPELPDDPAQLYRTVVVLIQDPSVQSVVGSVGGLVGAVGASLYNVFLSLLIAFFLLVSDRAVGDWFRAEVLGVDSLSAEYLGTVDRGLKSVYFGYTLTIFAVMALTSVLYTLFDLFAPGTLSIPSAVLLGVVTGVFTLVPLVGRSIVYFLVAAVLGVQAALTDPVLLWYPLVFLAVMTLLFDNVVRTYIRPYLSGRELSTGLVMFAYLLGPPLFGWYGIFLGPFLLVFVVVFVRRVLPLLADPDRGRERFASPTLDTFDEAVTGGETEPAPETDRGDVEPG